MLNSAMDLSNYSEIDIAIFQIWRRNFTLMIIYKKNQVTIYFVYAEFYFDDDLFL